MNKELKEKVKKQINLIIGEEFFSSWLAGEFAPSELPGFSVFTSFAAYAEGIGGFKFRVDFRIHEIIKNTKKTLNSKDIFELANEELASSGLVIDSYETHQTVKYKGTPVAEVLFDADTKKPIVYFMGDSPARSRTTRIEKMAGDQMIKAKVASGGGVPIYRMAIDSNDKTFAYNGQIQRAADIDSPVVEAFLKISEKPLGDDFHRFAETRIVPVISILGCLEAVNRSAGGGRIRSQLNLPPYKKAFETIRRLNPGKLETWLSKRTKGKPDREEIVNSVNRLIGGNALGLDHVSESIFGEM